MVSSLNSRLTIFRIGIGYRLGRSVPFWVSVALKLPQRELTISSRPNRLRCRNFSTFLLYLEIEQMPISRDNEFSFRSGFTCQNTIVGKIV
jgi:hypothetical protein